MVPLPRDLSTVPVGESISQAIWRFLSLEFFLNMRGCFKDVKILGC